MQKRGTKQRKHKPRCEPRVWDSLWEQDRGSKSCCLFLNTLCLQQVGTPGSRDLSQLLTPQCPPFTVPRPGIATSHLGGPEQCCTQTLDDAREAGAVQAWLLPAQPWQQLLWACFLLFLTVPDACVSKQWHLHTDWEPLPRSHRAPAPGRAREGWEWPGGRRAPGRDGGEMKGSKPRVRGKLEQQPQLSLLHGASSIRPRQKYTVL